MGRRRTAAAEAALKAIEENARMQEAGYVTEGKDCADCSSSGSDKPTTAVTNSAEKKKKEVQEKAAFRNSLQSYMVESFLGYVLEHAMKNRNVVISEDTKAMNASIVKGFVDEEGAANLITNMELKSNMLAEVARNINKIIKEEMEDYSGTGEVSSELQDNLYDKLDGSEEFQDVVDVIHNRVSQATQNFIQKNMVDKLDMKELMDTTKERIDDIRTGDDETDEQVRQEQTMRLKKEMRKINNRPHSIYEQLVINLTEGVIKNDKAKNKFTTESGKLDMGAIVERATSFYTLLESINSLQLKTLTHDDIQDMIKIG